MTCRKFRTVVRSSVLVTGVWLAVAAAQAPTQSISPVIKINEEAAKADIQTVPLRDGISVLSGSGGNIGVLTGADGKLMVDAGIAVSKDKLSAVLKAISDKPVKYLINTHYHWDHTDGNPWVHEAGATIVATPGTAARVTRSTRVDDWNYTFKPLPAGGVPTVVVKKSKTYQFDGQAVDIIAVPPAHTDTDLYVTFKPADVVFMGDLFWNGVYPFIDNENGGGIDGMIREDTDILSRVTDKTIIVPGHGPVGNRKQLVEFRDMLVSIRDNVAALKKQGKTRDQVIAAKPTAKFDEKYGHFVIDPDLFTRIVYDGLK